MPPDLQTLPLRTAVREPAAGTAVTIERIAHEADTVADRVRARPGLLAESADEILVAA